MKTTSSEFDDLPGFVAGKVLYFVKGVTVQPFSVVRYKTNSQQME